MARNPDTLDPSLRRPGRAAQSNAPGRYEAEDRSFDDDGWHHDSPDSPLRTRLSIERPRSAITYNRSPDLPFDRSINPYRGCEHGCIYCFARPSHAWLGMSPGLDFETRLVARPNMPAVLAAELRKPAYRAAPIAIGTNTDPYQPVEKDQRIMRACLETLRDFNHPVAVVTKGSLIERDIDILSDMAAKGLARVGISVTTLDPGLSRQMETRAPAPSRRLRMIENLSQAGIPVRVMVSPVIPGLTCHDLEPILQAAAGAGATSASWIMLRLPLEVAPLFREWLEHCYPNRAARVMGHVRDMHDGKDYAADWGRRMRGTGPYAQMMARRFQVAIRRLGLEERQPPLRCDLFQPPPRAGDQLTLF